MKTRFFSLATVTFLALTACSKGPEWRGDFVKFWEEKTDEKLDIKSLEIKQEKDSPEFFFIMKVKTETGTEILKGNGTAKGMKGNWQFEIFHLE